MISLKKSPTENYAFPVPDHFENVSISIQKQVYNPFIENNIFNGLTNILNAYGSQYDLYHKFSYSRRIQTQPASKAIACMQ